MPIKINSIAGETLFTSRGANLRDANLSPDTTIETGEKWSQYLAEVVPALLTAGKKSIQQILAAGAWDCHDWQNCPIAEAFSVHNIQDVPILYRPRAEQFIRYFDAQLIPVPVPALVSETL